VVVVIAIRDAVGAADSGTRMAAADVMGRHEYRTMMQRVKRRRGGFACNLGRRIPAAIGPACRARRTGCRRALAAVAWR